MAIQETTRVSKRKTIYERLFQGIMSGEYQPGDKMPSENELSELYKASRPTVSGALNELRKKGLVERLPGSGTYVKKAGQVADQKIGLMVPRHCIAPREFGHFVSLFSRYVQEMSHIISRNDHVLLMNDLPFGEDAEIMDQTTRICEQLIDFQVKGVFFMPLELREKNKDFNRKIAHRLRDHGISVVLLDRDIVEPPMRSDFDMICLDNRQAAFVATRHLLSLGCKSIDLVAGPLDATSISERILGYQDALIAAGIAPEPSRVHRFEIKPFSSDDETLEKNAVDHLLGEITRKTDALLCVNDRIAATLMRYCGHLGIRIPEDFRLMGFDDESFALHLPVALSTMRQPIETMAHEAVQMMVSRIEHPEFAPRDVKIAAELVVRESCGSK